MKQLTDDVWVLWGPPRYAINVYLIGDVLVDSGSSYEAMRILPQLRGRDVRAHAVSHAHGDHMGSSKRICEALGIPFWVGDLDADVAERPTVGRQFHTTWNPLVRNPASWLALRAAGRPADRRLQDGDEVSGGFVALHIPGHTPGQMAFWREADGVLLLGDALYNVDLAMGFPGLLMAPPQVHVDAELNKASLKRLADLEPKLVCFGHGAPMRDGRKFVDFVRRHA